MSENLPSHSYREERYSIQLRRVHYTERHRTLLEFCTHTYQSKRLHLYVSSLTRQTHVIARNMLLRNCVQLLNRHMRELSHCSTVLRIHLSRKTCKQVLAPCARKARKYKDAHLSYFMIP